MKGKYNPSTGGSKPSGKKLPAGEEENERLRRFNHFAPRSQPIFERRAILKFGAWKPSIVLETVTAPPNEILITATSASLI